MRPLRTPFEPSAPFRCFGYETLAAIAAGTLFLLIALTIITRGNPYTDEAMDADIPINIAEGRGQVSFAHANCIPGAPCAVVAPCYTYALAAWLWLLPQSRFAVMAFNSLAVTASVIAIWAAVARTTFLATAFTRLSLLLFIPFLPPLLQVYGTNRYDSVAMLGYGLSCLLLTSPRSRSQLALMTACGCLIGSGGIHCAISAFPLAGLLVLLTGKAFVRPLIAGLAGVCLGFLLTFMLIFSNEAMISSFRQALQIDNVRPATSLIDYLRAPLRGGHHSILRGGNIWLVLTLLLLLGTEPSRKYWTTATKCGLFGLASGIFVPIALTVVGRYSFTYAWLAAVPMAVGAFALASHRPAWNMGTVLATPLLLAAVLPGLPLKAATTAADWSVNSYDTVSSFVTATVNPTDVVYASYGAYYPVKQTAHSAYFGLAIHAMTPGQTNLVTAVVLNEDDLLGTFFSPTRAEIFAKLGGKWSEEASLAVPRSRLRMTIPVTPLGRHVFNYKIYRRDVN